jgi:chorismate lyase / 3-hydroxybenzoate synthase
MAAVLSSSSLSPARDADAGAVLRFERAVEALAVGPMLASRVWRSSGSDTEASPRLLHPSSPVHEHWFGAGAPVHRVEGCLTYAIDGPLLFGSAVIDDACCEGGLRAAAEQAYAEIFALLQRSGCSHLLRVWNYMARINEVVDGLERYRQFNVGRQQAFLAAGRSAFVGAPAACALGVSRGPLTVHFLAGTGEPRAVENPRQVSAYHYPAEYGPRSPTFSRAALVALDGRREALFISGTASIVGHATLHAGDVHRQTLETLDNIETVVACARAGSALPPQHAHALDRLDCTVYLRNEADLPQVREAFERRLGADTVAARRAVYVRADVCRSDLLVEIEAQHIGGPAATAAGK